jgi:hypothetical protein
MSEQLPTDYDDVSDAAPNDNVVPLGRPAPAQTAPPETLRPQGKLHRSAIAGMAICALAGIASMLVFITVTWPGNSGRYVVAAFIASGVGFLTSASIAVFSAARETFVPPPTSESESETE